MEEMEVPTEHLQEKIHEEAEEKMREAKERWTLYVALSTAFMAVLAAIAGLLSGHHVNEALIEQIKSSDQWNYYQAKGIKSEIIASAGKTTPSAEEEVKTRVEKYKKEQEEIKQKAEELEKDTDSNLALHIKLSRALTLFQISIAVSAISILTKRKLFWYIGICFSVAACFFLLQGIL